ncbi:MAG: aminotransferase class I/II-fold pyridoxal phosphate-dependent enzyme [Alteromonadaceae bacterium]|nr:aminotransferase class I/II-fold pyridoxal phosphate-dependent enzyme [Alteromonadaceae bacterium]
MGAVVARQFAGNQQGIDVAQGGMQGLSVEIFSACPHASMIKGLGLAGFGQQQITRVNTLENSEQMDVDHLSLLLKNSKAKSKIVIASSATVTATSFDDLEAVSALCQQHKAWLHVDAAFGLFERVVTGKEGKTKGIEMADSITLDFHKWLNVPYDAGAFFTRQPSLLVQCCEVDAPYLTNNEAQPDFLAMGIENSRRFRALPVWFTLLKYGREGIKEWVQRNMELADELANWIEQRSEFELSVPCQLNVVVFRPYSKHLSNEQSDKFTTLFLEQVNKDGKIFLSPGVWQGQKVIRAALSNWQTSKEDIALAKKSLLSCYKMLVSE